MRGTTQLIRKPKSFVRIQESEYPVPVVRGFKQGKFFLISTMKIGGFKPRSIHQSHRIHSVPWRLTHVFFFGKPTVLLSMFLGSIILTSCASSVPKSANPALSEMQSKNQAGNSAAAPAEAQLVRSRPRLIKKAAMTLIVDSLKKSIDAVSQIINQQQGDLIRLEEQQPQNEYGRHTAFIELRVPQNLLEPTLDEIAKLGTLESRNITAEDVGDQLVDLQARLNNLRKTESNLQKIMDRAGSIADVLSVAKELSNVRQSIEQIDAQLKNLQNQVAYSTITLNIEAAISTSNPQRALGSQIQQTWNNSTHSLSEFTVILLKLGIWLIVYSPYLLILIAAGYGFRRWRRNSRPVKEQGSGE